MFVTVMLKKELSLCRSNVALVVSILLFALGLSLSLSFAFLHLGITYSEKVLIYPGIIVGTALFLAMLLFNQTALLEREEGALQGLLLLGVPANELFISKATANFLLFMCCEGVILSSFGIFFDGSIFSIFGEVSIITGLLGLSICSLGTMLSLISVVAPNREVLFSIIFLPLIFPAIGATSSLLQQLFSFEGSGGSIIDWWSFPAVLLICCSIVYSLTSALLWAELI